MDAPDGGLKVEAASRVDYSPANHRWMRRMVGRREGPVRATGATIPQSLKRPHRGRYQAEFIFFRRLSIGQLPNTLRKGCEITIKGLVTDRCHLRVGAIGSECEQGNDQQQPA